MLDFLNSLSEEFPVFVVCSGNLEKTYHFNLATNIIGLPLHVVSSPCVHSLPPETTGTVEGNVRIKGGAQLEVHREITKVLDPDDPRLRRIVYLSDDAAGSARHTVFKEIRQALRQEGVPSSLFGKPFPGAEIGPVASVTGRDRLMDILYDGAHAKQGDKGINAFTFYDENVILGRRATDRDRVYTAIGRATWRLLGTADGVRRGHPLPSTLSDLGMLDGVPLDEIPYLYYGFYSARTQALLDMVRQLTGKSYHEQALERAKKHHSQAKKKTRSVSLLLVKAMRVVPESPFIIRSRRPDLDIWHSSDAGTRITVPKDFPTERQRLAADVCEAITPPTEFHGANGHIFVPPTNDSAATRFLWQYWLASAMEDKAIQRDRSPTVICDVDGYYASFLLTHLSLVNSGLTADHAVIDGVTNHGGIRYLRTGRLHVLSGNKLGLMLRRAEDIIAGGYRQQTGGMHSPSVQPDIYAHTIAGIPLDTAPCVTVFLSCSTYNLIAVDRAKALNEAIRREGLHLDTGGSDRKDHPMGAIRSQRNLHAPPYDRIFTACDIATLENENGRPPADAHTRIVFDTMYGRVPGLATADAAILDAGGIGSDREAFGLLAAREICPSMANRLLHVLSPAHGTGQLITTGDYHHIRTNPGNFDATTILASLLGLTDLGCLRDTDSDLLRRYGIILHTNNTSNKAMDVGRVVGMVADGIRNAHSSRIPIPQPQI